jgi:hypothetical protein
VYDRGERQQNIAQERPYLHRSRTYRPEGESFVCMVVDNAQALLVVAIVTLIYSLLLTLIDAIHTISTIELPIS